ncbi:MAG: minichromosome maintenance protein MCM [Candidatus Bathyarchaeia archaeon]
MGNDEPKLFEAVDPQSKFEFFLKGEKYRKALAQLSINGGKALYVDFQDLYAYDSQLATDLIEKPAEYLKHFNNAARNQLAIEDPEYLAKVGDSLVVRIVNMYEATPIRQVGAQDLFKLRMVKGMVVKTTVVKPKILKASYECLRCGTRTEVVQREGKRIKPVKCSNPHCQRAGPFRFVPEESKMINVQDIWIQEAPEELPAGQLPRSFHIRAYEDLVDKARPGDIIAAVGIIEPLEIKDTALTFDVYMIANSITLLNKEPEATPTSEEIARIHELAKDPWIHRKIIQSIAPAIYGHEDVKEAIMYLLFGGVPKEFEGTKIRGEIHVLLVGDPGTAKTQLLRFVQSIAPRGIYTSGRGSTGAGLTAACQRDPDTGEMTLEAGALVLADRGVVCIDEIEKMRPEDRVNIHEPLESQTISVAKGGIVATLNARTAVLAAANPVFGRYNLYRTIFENLATLPVTLLSRFDLIFLMLDQPDKELDKKLAQHVLRLHGRAATTPPIPRELLRKYVAYARQINPELTKEAQERIENFYLRVREKTSGKEELTEIGVRYLESLVRIAEARARAALRKEVTAEDAEAAITMMQKSLKQIGVDAETGTIDMNLIMTGKPKSLRDKMDAILALIVEAQRETGMVEEAYLIKELEEKYKIDKTEAKKIIAQLKREGAIFEPREGYLRKT